MTLPALADHVEGEHVLLAELNELQAEATLRAIEPDGRRVWFTDIGDPDAIQVIYPYSSDAPASARHPTQA